MKLKNTTVKGYIKFEWWLTLIIMVATLAMAIAWNDKKFLLFPAIGLPLLAVLSWVRWWKSKKIN